MANKTDTTDASVAVFLAALDEPKKQADSEALVAMMSAATGCEARMWGASIIGFGRYHYRYDSGREGESMLIGFSPRKAQISVYIMPGLQTAPELMEQLGKHKAGKSCVYIKRLSDVDIRVLDALVHKSVAVMTERHDVIVG